MEKYYDPEKYMELGTCFVREDILLRDGVHKIDGRKKNELENQEIFDPKSLIEEERFIKKLVDLQWQRESFQINFLEDREGSFSFMETKGRESRKIIKKQYGKC